MSIERILIPTDFSETAELAVAHGAYMAQLFNAKIFLLHSIQYPAYALLPEEPTYMQQVIPLDEDKIEQQLNQAADEIVKKYKVELSCLTLSGRPASSIAEAVNENNIDVIIMGTHGTSGFDEFFIGSNTNRVVTTVDCPVLSVQKLAQKVGFRNIILPIDNELHSRQKVNNAIELANAYKSTVHILGLLEDDEDESDEKKLALRLGTVKDALEHARVPFSCTLRRGQNPAVEAMKYSDEMKGDLILVMRGHESTVGRAFLGPFAEQLVNHSKIPVMSIKPEDTTIEVFDDTTGGTGVII
jgi:nucleotide-binding universal stress UspA family protein